MKRLIPLALLACGGAAQPEPVTPALFLSSCSVGCVCVGALNPDTAPLEIIELLVSDGWACSGNECSKQAFLYEVTWRFESSEGFYRDEILEDGALRSWCEWSR